MEHTHNHNAQSIYNAYISTDAPLSYRIQTCIGGVVGYQTDRIPCDSEEAKQILAGLLNGIMFSENATGGLLALMGEEEVADWVWDNHLRVQLYHGNNEHHAVLCAMHKPDLSNMPEENSAVCNVQVMLHFDDGSAKHMIEYDPCIPRRTQEEYIDDAKDNVRLYKGSYGYRDGHDPDIKRVSYHLCNYQGGCSQNNLTFEYIVE